MTLKSGLFFLLAVGLLTAQCSVAQALFANDTKQPAFPGPPTQQEEESEANLEEEYRIEVENISAEKRQLTFELQRDLRILKLAQPNSEGELIPADDVRRVKLLKLRKQEVALLEKLTSLNPEEPEYRYKLALSFFERSAENERGLELLNSISPLDKPGYIPGHLFLSKYYLNIPKVEKSQAVANVRRAMVHAENCLRQDASNVEAMEIKAKLLYLQRRFLEANVVFERLFASNPLYFEALCDINQRLNQTDKNSAVIASAIKRFDRTLNRSPAISIAQRTEIWQKLVKCYLLKKDYETAESRLLEEIKLWSAESGNGKQIWPEHLLSNVYGSWLREIPPSTAEGSRKRLELATKAFQYNGNNEAVLRELARLGFDQNEEIASEARKVYDPTTSSSAPAMVLSDLGSRAVGRKEYDSAIRYFEMARKKLPKSPEILNNLAYTYLASGSSKPERALGLVDQALDYLPKSPSNEKYRSHFYDTRAIALMRLDRMAEAAAEFENALQARPDDEKVLESLIECCKAAELDCEDHEKHLREIRQRAAKEK